VVRDWKTAYALLAFEKMMKDKRKRCVNNFNLEEKQLIIEIEECLNKKCPVNKYINLSV